VAGRVSWCLTEVENGDQTYMYESCGLGKTNHLQRKMKNCMKKEINTIPQDNNMVYISINTSRN